MSTSLHQIAELLIQQALSGLSQQEQQQLQRLRLENNVSESDLRDEMEKIELAAAAADLASFDNQAAEIPEHVKNSVLVEAGKFLEAQSSTPTEQAPAAQAAPPMQSQPRPSQTTTATRVNGWVIATILSTAACLFLLLFPVGRNNQTPTPSVAELRDAFLESAPIDLIDIDMVANDALDANGRKLTDGRLVWSDAKQEGYMEFSGLKVNNPDDEQYQLWIFQEEGLETQPIDGGVFDIANANELIKIDAKLLAKAKFFAVTVEKPGGVVVSDRKRIATIDAELAAKLAAATAAKPVDEASETDATKQPADEKQP